MRRWPRRAARPLGGVSPRILRPIGPTIVAKQPPPARRSRLFEPLDQFNCMIVDADFGSEPGRTQKRQSPVHALPMPPRPAPSSRHAEAAPWAERRAARRQLVRASPLPESSGPTVLPILGRHTIHDHSTPRVTVERRRGPRRDDDDEPRETIPPPGLATQPTLPAPARRPVLISPHLRPHAARDVSRMTRRSVQIRTATSPRSARSNLRCDSRRSERRASVDPAFTTSISYGGRRPCAVHAGRCGWRRIWRILGQLHALVAAHRAAPTEGPASTTLLDLAAQDRRSRSGRNRPRLDVFAADRPVRAAHRYLVREQFGRERPAWRVPAAAAGQRLDDAIVDATAQPGGASLSLVFIREHTLDTPDVRRPAREGVTGACVASALSDPCRALRDLPRHPVAAASTLPPADKFAD